MAGVCRHHIRQQQRRVRCLREGVRLLAPLVAQWRRAAGRHRELRALSLHHRQVRRLRHHHRHGRTREHRAQQWRRRRHRQARRIHVATRRAAPREEGVIRRRHRRRRDRRAVGHRVRRIEENVSAARHRRAERRAEDGLHVGGLIHRQQERIARAAHRALPAQETPAAVRHRRQRDHRARRILQVWRGGLAVHRHRAAAGRGHVQERRPEDALHRVGLIHHQRQRVVRARGRALPAEETPAVVRHARQRHRAAHGEIRLRPDGLAVRGDRAARRAGQRQWILARDEHRLHSARAVHRHRGGIRAAREIACPMVKGVMRAGRRGERDHAVARVGSLRRTRGHRTAAAHGSDQ